MNRRPATRGSLEWAAARYVERFGGTTRRLRRVLEKRLTPEDPPELRAFIDEIVARYVASGMVDDAAFAASKVRRMVRRGVPPAVVRARLGAEGLDATAGLAEHDGDADLYAACAWLRRRRLGGFRPGERDDKADLARMGRAGFSYAVAQKALGMDPEYMLAILVGSGP